MSFLNKSRSMFSVLVVPFIVQMVLLASLITALSYYAGRAAVEDLLNRGMQDLVDSTEQNIRSQVDKSDLLSRALSHSATSYGDGFANPIATESLLFKLTAMTPFVNFIYVGRPNGDFIGVDRLPDRTVVHVKNQATAGQKMVYVARQAGERGEIVAEMSKPYNTLSRPWYQLAAEKKIPAWTSVYLSSSKNILEVTKAVPVLDAKGKLQAVIGSDLPLAQISDYLRQHTISTNGMAFVMETSGALIASSKKISADRDTLHGQKLLKAVESDEPLIHLTAAQLLNKLPGPGMRTNFRFEHDGNLIEVSAKGLDAAPGLGWVTVVAAPRNDFMDNVIRSTWRTVFISLAVFALAILVGIIGLHWVTRDLKRLADAASKFVGNAAEGTKLPDSRLKEVDALSKSLALMMGRVRDTMQAISAKNVELEMANNNMEHLLTRLNLDALTGLYNRTATLERLQNSMRQHRHTELNEKIAVLYLDLDEFKFTNDTLGHAAGDTVLTETAARLKACTRESDTIGRMGGDEFVLVLPHLAEPLQAQAIAEKIIQALNAPVKLSSGSVIIHASIGVAIFPDHTMEPNELIELADQAMYVAKSSGKNKVATWKA
ncbi:MAG: diguanylate cyclase [Burkholderiales bacterium]